MNVDTTSEFAATGSGISSVLGQLLVVCSALVFTACAGDDRHPATATATLTLHRTGAATGTLSVDGAVLPCNGTCTTTLPLGTVVTVTASPGTGAVFGGWQGAGCTGTAATCQLSVAGDVDLAAQFDFAAFTLTVFLLGTGADDATITSTPAGIACPGVCAMPVLYSTQVELHANAGPSAQLVGWGDACSGKPVSGPCTLTITADAEAAAGFLGDNPVQVTLLGDGHGTVASDLDGISCGSACAHKFRPGTLVTLTASADGDSVFAGWERTDSHNPECSGPDGCQFTVPSSGEPVTINATFALK